MKARDMMTSPGNPIFRSTVPGVLKAWALTKSSLLVYPAADFRMFLIEQNHAFQPLPIQLREAPLR